MSGSAVLAANVLLVLAPACGGSSPGSASRAPVMVAVPSSARAASPEQGRAGEQGRFRCEVEVRTLGAEHVGEASGADGEAVAEQAEREVCKKLWEAEKVDCKNESMVATVSREQHLRIINGQPSHTVRITMRTLGKTFQGRGSSAESGGEACRRAVDAACAKAPAGSVCSGLGLYCSASPDDPSLWRCSPTPRERAPRREPSPFEV